jgi:transposase
MCGRQLGCCRSTNWSRPTCFAAERIHGDDTTVPVLAKVKTRTGRLWTYVRRSSLLRQRSAGRGVFLLARSERRASRAASGRIFRPNAYVRFNELYRPERPPGPIAPFRRRDLLRLPMTYQPNLEHHCLSRR